MNHINGLNFESFEYDQQWAGTADSKIFESAHDFRIETNRHGRFEWNRISKLRRSLISLAVCSFLLVIQLSCRPYYASCPSVCPSICQSVCPVRFSKLKTKKVEQPKLSQTFHRAWETGVTFLVQTVKGQVHWTSLKMMHISRFAASVTRSL